MTFAGNCSIPTAQVVKFDPGGRAFFIAIITSGRNFWPPVTPQTKLKFIGSLKNPCLAMMRVLSRPPMS